MAASDDPTNVMLPAVCLRLERRTAAVTIDPAVRAVRHSCVNHRESCRAMNSVGTTMVAGPERLSPSGP